MKAAPSFQSEQQIQTYLIRIIGPLYVVLALIGSTASALRAVDTGWQWVYGVHFLLAICGLVVFLSPERWMPEMLRIWVAILIPAAVGVPALMTFGFYSNGIIWLLISCSMAGIFLRSQQALLMALLILLLLVGIALLFIARTLTLAMDANQFIYQPSGWISLFLGTGVGICIMMTVLVRYRSSIRSLLRTVEQQRDLIRYQADHDSLTGLVSLRLARDRLAMACERALREQRKVALLFIDLDGFKAANDQFGHAAGDQVLIEVARRLHSSVRATDTAARLGGDEFMLLLEGSDSTADISQIAAKLIDSICQPIRFQQAEIQIGCSIGIALYPDHGNSADQILRHADAAMYDVKKSGKNNFALYNGPLAGSALTEPN